MTIFGKALSEYVSFVKWFCLLLFVVGITRLTLSLNGVPNTSTRLVSMSVVMLIGTIFYSIRIHTSGFGAYKQLFPVIFIPNAVTHVVSITGIVIGIITGEANIFTAPEYAFEGDGRTWGHVGAHVAIGMTAGALVNWLIGCLFLFIAKKVVKSGNVGATVRP